MTRSNKLSNAMFAGARLGCLLLLFTNFTMAQTILAENFNRPDGTVGNGWSSWWGTMFQHPNISLVNGELRTYGFNGFAGGIFRSVPISFPVAVSFDYRTLSRGECVTGHNDGGWLFTLNGAPVTFPPPYNTNAQVTFFQYHGGGPVVRSYLTANGRVNDIAPGVSPALSGMRDYGAVRAAHIEAAISPDLSATFTIRYNDGQTPDPVTVSFGPAVGALGVAPGSVFVLSNSNCSFGPHFFDNLEIRTIPTKVEIDIHPGSCPNSINPASNGVIPVAILTTAAFRANTINPVTVRFGVNGTEAAPVQFALTDVDRDGDLDLILHFRTQQTGIGCQTTSAFLTGKTFAGKGIEGSDSVKPVGCK